MRLIGVTKPVTSPLRGESEFRAADSSVAGWADDPDTPGGAITVEPTACATAIRPMARRPVAAFVAHLIAISRNEPQTRVLRRGTPEQAISAYADTNAPRASVGGMLRQSF